MLMVHVSSVCVSKRLPPPSPLYSFMFLLQCHQDFMLVQYALCYSRSKAKVKENDALIRSV